MAVIDRGILDEALDTSAGFLNATYLFKNFSLSAQNATVSDLLDGIDEASENNPEVRAITDLMRDDPALGQAFRAHMITNGRGTLRDIDDLVEADGIVTAEQIREAFPVARAGTDFEISAAELEITEQEAAFLTELEVTETEMDGLIAAEVPNIWDGDDGITLQSVIANRTPAEFLDAVADADPENAELQETINLIKADPELATALHSAVANDPTMLAGFQEILTAEGEGAVGLEDLNAILENSMQRGILTEVLTNIGDGSVDSEGADIDYSHLRAIIDADDNAARLAAVQAAGAGDSLNPLAGIDSWADIIELLRNPGEFIRDLVSSIEGLPPEFQNMLAGVLDVTARGLGGFMDLEGDFVGHYYRAGSDLAQAAGEHGATIMGTSFETPTGTETRTHDLDGVTSTTSFDPAATGQSVIDDAATIAESTVTRPDPTVVNPRVAEVVAAPAP